MNLTVSKGESLDKTLAKLAAQNPVLVHKYVVVSHDHNGNHFVDEMGNVALHAEGRARMHKADGRVGIQIFVLAKSYDKDGKVDFSKPAKYIVDTEHTEHAFAPRPAKEGDKPKKADEGLTPEQKRKVRAALQDVEAVCRNIRSQLVLSGEVRQAFFSTIVNAGRRIGWSADDMATDFLTATENLPSDEA